MVGGILVEKKTERDIKAAQTRRRVIIAARELFEKHGYAATTVAAITRRAKVAKGTFFVHFATKDAVITELVRVQTAKAMVARAAAFERGGGPLDALEATVLMLGREAGASRLLSRAVLAATLEKQEIGDQTSRLFDDVFSYMIDDARASGVAAPEMLARALMTAYLGAALHFTTTPRTPPLSVLLAPLVAAHLLAARKEKPHAHPTAARAAHPGRRLLQRARPAGA